MHFTEKCEGTSQFCLKMELILNHQSTINQKFEFANREDLDEVAHHEPPHLGLHYLPSAV